MLYFDMEVRNLSGRGLLILLGWLLFFLVSGSLIYTHVSGKHVGKDNSDRGGIGEWKYHKDREENGKEARDGRDVIENFVKRAKRGMTDREIEGIVEEYENLIQVAPGLDWDDLWDKKKRLNGWYAGALKDGLSLSGEQLDQVETNLAIELSNEIEQWEKIMSEYELPNQSPENFSMLQYSSIKMLSISYAPWKLCDLTEEQARLTTKRRWDERSEQSSGEASDRLSGSSWISYRRLTMQDPYSGSSSDYPSTSVMDAACKPAWSSLAVGGVLDTCNIFPLTPDQTIADHRYHLMEQVRMLHPAQLRMALITNTYIASSIRAELKKESSH